MKYRTRLQINRAYKRKRDAISCSKSSKTRWGSEETARYALAGLREKYPGMFSSGVRPYRCPHCKRWHLGHEQGMETDY